MVPQFYRGKEGRPIQVAANYLKLDVAPGKGVFEYEVSYEPRIDNRNHRFKLLNQHRGTGILGPEKVKGSVMMFDCCNFLKTFFFFTEFRWG